MGRTQGGYTQLFTSVRRTSWVEGTAVLVGDYVPSTVYGFTANLVIVVIPGVLAAPAAYSDRNKIRNDDADALFEGERWVGMAPQPSSILQSGGGVGLSAQSRATSAYLEAEGGGDRRPQAHLDMHHHQGVNLHGVEEGERWMGVGRTFLRFVVSSTAPPLYVTQRSHPAV